ncbi:hypothetical protein E3N88_26028 [Mikania micrantha]|uniref:Uncharacterized protein n=1 Tax=Mikania micrantha TaxID=192012 RepID=A0A5N6N6E7_9ASTR|nr:hypothetical protein E3N88_26028 [Mikania micrantha]
MGSSWYAKDGIRVLSSTRWTKISEIPPDFFAVREAFFGSSSRLFHTKNTHTSSSNHHPEAIRSYRSHQGTYLQVRIVVLPAEIRQIR